MDVLDPLILARWQFGLTTLYHYLFVPLTIAFALAQTRLILRHELKDPANEAAVESADHI